MIKNLDSSEQGLFNEVVVQGMSVGATTMESYHDVVKQVIEDHRSVGELNDDQDLVGFEEVLRSRFEEYISLMESDAEVKEESVLDEE
ncbi:MAG: hypothetical protein O2877_00960 [bacterium]|nr:hypothetical protein [bacterium]